MTALGSISPQARVVAADKLVVAASKALGKGDAARPSAVRTALQLAEDAAFEMKGAVSAGTNAGFTATPGLSPRATGLVGEAFKRVRTGQQTLDSQLAGIKATQESSGSKLLSLLGGSSGGSSAGSPSIIGMGSTSGPTAYAGAERLWTPAQLAPGRMSMDDLAKVLTQQAPKGAESAASSAGTGIAKVRTSFDEADKLLKQALVAQQQSSGARERSLALHKQLGTVDETATLEKARVQLPPARKGPDPFADIKAR